MRYSRFPWLLIAALSLAGCAGPRWYSPLTAEAVGPAGPPAMISVQPHPSPSTTLRVTASGPVAENDFQWVLIPLDAAPESVTDVEVCYQVEAAAAGGTYISQVRLTRTDQPDSALVLHDDATNLTSTTPTCYVSVGSADGPGTLTLALKVVFANAGERIKVGGIRLNMR